MRGKLQLQNDCAGNVQALDVRWCEGMSLLEGLMWATGWGCNGLAPDRGAFVNFYMGMFS